MSIRRHSIPLAVSISDQQQESLLAMIRAMKQDKAMYREFANNLLVMADLPNDIAGTVELPVPSAIIVGRIALWAWNHLHIVAAQRAGAEGLEAGAKEGEG